MDFYSIFDDNKENNESKASENNSVSNNSSSSDASSSAQQGVPFRWDFKSVLRQEEEAVTEPQANSSAEEVSMNAESEHSVAQNVETSGDPEFDRQWAEMIAKENNAEVVNEEESVNEITAAINEEPIVSELDNVSFESETVVFAESEVADPVFEEEIFVNELTSEVNSESNETIVSEMISSEEIIAEVNSAAEFEMKPVFNNEEFASEIVASTENEVAAEANVTEDIMSEFTPIQLADEIQVEAEISAAPVFVNVEHSWMYAEAGEMKAEVVTETQDIFNTSLPGELPLFCAEVNSDVNADITNTHTNNNQSEEAMKFELPEYSSIIKVIGVGGGGSNAVNHMYKFGIKGVDFLVCNTDKQALDLSPVPHKIVLGATLTEGRGAGSIPEVGRNAAIENIEDLRQVLSKNTKMVFITAGMGGGTGTGAAPVIAGVARELGILTVGIVTVPFSHEGKKRRQYAEEGIEQLKQNVDTLLVIRNDKLREMYGNLKLSDAFAHADDVLTTAAKSIAEIISLTQQINVDFADICTVMRNSGVAIMGSAQAAGENRAVRSVEMALNSPLLNDNNIIGARYVLLNIISGSDEITMDELGEITDYIQEAAGQTAEIIKGYGVDPSLGDSVSVTIIATGFQQSSPVNYEYAPKAQPSKVVLQLDEVKAEVLPVAEVKVEEKEMNPLEPFLVSKSIEPVAEINIEPEQKFETPVWTNVNSIELEVVNTSEEILEPVNQVSDISNSSSEIVNEVPEIEAEETVEPELIIKKVVAEIDPVEAAKKAEQEEIQRRANERIQKLREISLKLKSPGVLNEMENEPAYKRRNVSLDNVPHSSESQVSRFTLTETDEKKIEIRPNNSFLHDNVD
jgi:cell division protein FtsZ